MDDEVEALLAWLRAAHTRDEAIPNDVKWRMFTLLKNLDERVQALEEALRG